jgi:hypothetical protein
MTSSHLKSPVARPAGRGRSCARRLAPLAVLAAVVFRTGAQTDMAIYTDAFQNGWEDWSWSATRDPNNGSPVNTGSKSIAVTFTGTWAALSLHHADINTSTYSNLTFWINGGATGGQLLQIYAEAPGGTNHPAVQLAALPTNSWRKITLSMSALGIANLSNFARFSIQDRIGSVQSTFYVDDIILGADTNPAPFVTLTSPSNGSSYGAPASISLAATVVPNAHTISKVQFYNGTTLLNEDTTAPYSYTWTNVSVGTYSLTARAVYEGGATVDSSAVNVTVTGNTAVTIAVDVQANRHAISPLIYGAAFATSNQVNELNLTLNRSGGNAETRYNWQLNAHNHAADWYFESIADSSSTAAAADDHIANSKNGGAQPMMTIPMVDWMPKLGSGRGKLASYSIAKYGPQTGSDASWMPDAGNGVGTNTTAHTSWLITTNDPNDANFQTNSLFQQAYVRYLTNRWGVSTNGGVRYYLMDNEHSIWHSTHRDIHPVGATMKEIRDKMFEYAGMVKSNDPNVLVLGPEEFGWSGYFNSGYDLWYGDLHKWTNSISPDRSTNGGWDYMPWLLNQFYQRSLTNGNQRLLDYFTLHCYPEDTSVAGDAVDTDTQQLRNRLTRKFWDTNYVDETWIGSQTINIVMLIPRMKAWVNSNYPGTKIGITEYNWGAEGHINGATAQADIMGIFGREGLDLATRWTTPGTGSPTYLAMKLYRNYDGNKSTFGDTSVSASAPDPNTLTAYGATRSSDGALTLMVVNKSLDSGGALTVNLANFLAAGTGQVWQLTSANTINRLSDLAFSGNSFSATVPAQSVTLFVLPAGTVPSAPILGGVGLSSTNTFTFWLTNGLAGQRYVIQSCTGLAGWVPVQTNTLVGNWTNYAFPISDTQRFYRAQWAP